MAQINNDLIGKVLGTCRLEQPIGRGGMSVVYLAQQMRPQRRVAVKILLPNISTNSSVHDDFLARFLREADVVAKLEHPNIVQIYKCNLQDELAYLVMPYLPGGNLARVLAQRGTLSPQETLKYITEAAAALDYAHSQRIIHRDLKPSNFLLHADGRLVLADFGIAHMMQDRSNPRRATLTLSGSVLGTPDYIAPEMASGAHIDYRADIYELGIVLFQMLSGDVPFKGRTSVEIMLKHIEEPLPHLHSVNPAISPAIDAVIQKAAAKNPTDRYSSAGAVAQALSTAIHQPPYPVSHYEPTVVVLSPAPNPEITIPVYPGNKTEYANRNTPVMPQKPTISAKSTHRSWKPLVFGLLLSTLVLGLIISGGLVAFSKPPNSPPTLTPAQKAQQQAQKTVLRYYTYINQRNYKSAHSMVSTDTSTKAYCRFVNDFAQTDYDNVKLNGTPQATNGGFNVPIIIHATEETASGTWQTTYQGYQTVMQVNNVWMVAGGDLQKVGRSVQTDPTPNPDPTQEGQAIMQQYYVAINRRDYPAAYKLWGTALRSGTDYCGFVNDYAQTLSNKYSFGTIVQQSDGNVLVPMTIEATEQTQSETQSPLFKPLHCWVRKRSMEDPPGVNTQDMSLPSLKQTHHRRKEWLFIASRLLPQMYC